MSNSADSIDATVIRRIADGDRSAFESLYDAFSGPLFSLALRILSQPEDAEDLLQEVFAKLWKDAANYDSSRGVPLAWAFTVTRNKAIDRIRSRERRTRLRDNAELAAQTDPPPKPAAPDSAAAVSEESAAVRGAIGNLSGELRQAIELAYFRGLSQSEIASELDQPITTVKSRIRRAMVELRQSLKGVS
jgi:RNA polymerase sigma-70 factor (ECF subfamily)